MTYDDLNVPACLCVELCSLFAQECITSLSIYQSRLYQGAFVFPSLCGRCVKSAQGRTDFILHAHRAFVWVWCSVKTRCIKPQWVKHDTRKKMILSPQLITWMQILCRSDHNLTGSVFAWLEWRVCKNRSCQCYEEIFFFLWSWHWWILIIIFPHRKKYL